MPIDRFWLMIRNIERVRADSSISALSVSVAAARGDPKTYSETLRAAVGTTLVIENELDRDALKRLKALAQGKS